MFRKRMFVITSEILSAETPGATTFSIRRRSLLGSSSPKSHSPRLGIQEMVALVLDWGRRMLPQSTNDAIS
jgi:hypothetical protein